MTERGISIAMCTYNGEAYLAEQLDSIIYQSRPPDEIVICDDNSTDNTFSILEEYRQKFPDLIRLYRNEANLGPAKNFEKAISLCTKSLIALSDQDDVWRYDKLEKLAQKFQAEPRLGLVFSNAERIDSDGNVLKGDLWQIVGFDRRTKAAVKSGDSFWALLRRPFVTGCTMMFDTKLREICLPIEVEEPFLHDRWISMVAAASSRVDFLDEMLVAYRQHTSNVAGARKTSLKKSFVNFCQLAVLKHAQVVEYTQALNNLERLLTRLASTEIEQDQLFMIQEKTDFFKFRVELRLGRGSWRQKTSSLMSTWFRGSYRRCGYGPYGLLTLTKDVAVLGGFIK